MHKPSLLRSFFVALSTVLLVPTIVFGGTEEIEHERDVSESCPFGEIDWTSVFLTDFAVGGSAENCYDMDCPAQCEKCLARAGRNSSAETAAEPGEEADDCELPTADSLWTEEDVFCVEDAPGEKGSNAPMSSRRTATGARGLWRGTGQVFRAPQPRESSRRLFAQDAAKEILRLRRSVGVNPVAGTIFEQPAATVSGLNDGQSDASLSVAVSDDDSIEAAVRQLEADEAAHSAMPTEFTTWPAPEPAGAWAAQLLRPAERRLEEAADMLEQLGQYDRADMARDLAQQIRQDARQAERSRTGAAFGGVEVRR